MEIAGGCQAGFRSKAQKSGAPMVPIVSPGRILYDLYVIFDADSNLMGGGLRRGLGACSRMRRFIMSEVNKILIEVIYKADYCLPCLYMEQTVREVLTKYAEFIEYHRMDFLHGERKIFNFFL
jgi:hypothetical protein